jgi:hypothetical protein
MSDPLGREELRLRICLIMESQITEFTIRHNETAHPYKWSYDADADHARYLERHPRQQNLAQAALPQHNVTTDQ